jgi:hypothetical protein
MPVLYDEGAGLCYFITILLTLSYGNLASVPNPVDFTFFLRLFIKSAVLILSKVVTSNGQGE